MSKDKSILSQKEKNEQAANYIVGIGASAGGLEALQKLLTALPPDTGFPYIIVQHLAPDYKSLLGEILGKYTEMPVVQVENGMEVQPNCIYVIQPGKNMCIKDGRLQLSAQREKQLNLPIDMFFHSLSEEAGPRAIAIVLSGTGSDGTNGIKDIKEHDGLVIAQDPDSAKFDGMPRSAVRTGLVDALFTPEDIARELQHVSCTASKEPYQLAKSDAQVDMDLMKWVYAVLKKACNVNFTHYKQTTILRRVERRMMLTHKDSLAEYVDFLRESPEEAKTLSREVLIGVTNFFRDPEYFEQLKETAVRDILQRSTENEPVRVWVAGCSTGEEAYSIAILFCEVMDQLKLRRAVKIFATDLDVDSVSSAGKGVYGDNIINAVSPARLIRYFSRKNNSYVVNRDIRKMIVFSPHNVFQDPPFGRLDLISCRNMLIYFQPVLQNDLFAIFHTVLKDDGYLFLGKSEAIGAFSDAFPVVDAAAKIFSHHSEVKIPGQKTVPYLHEMLNEYNYDDEPSGRSLVRSVNAPDDIPADEEEINITLLERFMPACIVVNEKNEVTHMYGENANFVHLPIGKLSTNVFDLIAEALKVPTSTILKEARVARGTVQYKDIFFHGEREDAVINLTAMPIGKARSAVGSLYALVFSEQSHRGEMPDAVTYDIDRVSSQRITDLEQELSVAQNKLRRSVAEQECVNEELQAANEELLTANEELQSSNEELQSVNEELYTVNSEYQQKMTELADLNDDIANFLSSTLTGIIFVDNKMNIRRYTDYITTEFSVMDHDIGRSLKFISYHFPTMDITEICNNVLKTLIPDEREVVTSKNKVFFMRVAPYRSTEDKILGCVITFVDITKQKESQRELANAEKKLTAANESINAKVDYLSRVAHEIKTPMGALIELSKTAMEQRGDEQALTANLGKIDDAVKYMASIVTDISEASLAGRNGSKMKSEVFRLKKLLSNIDAMIAPCAKEAGIAFGIVTPDDFDPTYMGNETALQQILINFLNNSIKYTSHGSITLTVNEDSTLPTEPGKASLCFAITDTGIGISKEFIPELFKPFTRENANDTLKTSSMGLGLSIAKGLVEAMGGEVTVESEEGKGSIFRVRVPLVCVSETESDKKNSDGDTASLKGCRVLIAEDNELNRIIMKKILSDAGMDYTVAVDGEEAVSAYLATQPGTFDFILMDMRMPKLDGIRATDKIRTSSHGDAKAIPIIGISANGFVEDVNKAYAAGVNDYIAKPIDRDSLFAAMSRLKAGS